MQYQYGQAVVSLFCEFVTIKLPPRFLNRLFNLSLYCQSIDGTNFIIIGLFYNCILTFVECDE